MEQDASPPSNEQQIRLLLERWAHATRTGRRDEILANHAPDVLIYDVLTPLKYESAAAYRAGWDEWQPDTQGEGAFALRQLVVVAADDAAFAHGLIECGGSLPDGTSFEDLVRATFCLRKIGGEWKITHQHISKPLEPDGDA